MGYQYNSLRRRNPRLPGRVILQDQPDAIQRADNGSLFLFLEQIAGLYDYFLINYINTPA
ncbi:hypothetical protein F4804DRAFT_321914 [Jackrogersella minutella]|nr:hypothetical protein F4804DRAFT_321914 [Jackrogersella minutella]